MKLKVVSNVLLRSSSRSGCSEWQLFLFVDGSSIFLLGKINCIRWNKIVFVNWFVLNYFFSSILFQVSVFSAILSSSKLLSFNYIWLVAASVDDLVMKWVTAIDLFSSISRNLEGGK